MSDNEAESFFSQEDDRGTQTETDNRQKSGIENK